VEPTPYVEPAPVYEETKVTTYEEKPVGGECPVSVAINYTLVTDDIFRGVNQSEYPGEGREDLNHFVTMDLGLDIAQLVGQPKGQYGEFHFATLLDWFAGQDQLDPVHGGQNFQEADYHIWWEYYVEPIATTFSLGYSFFSYANNSGFNSQEWWLKFVHNDAWMWKWLFPDNDKGVLNPWVFFAQDVRRSGGACYGEMGVYHDFPLFENFTLRPSVTLGADHRYLHELAGSDSGPATRLAFLQYGLSARYNIRPLLQLPETIGDITIGAFLYYQNAFSSVRNDDVAHDEFWGGMNVGWSWGG